MDNNHIQPLPHNPVKPIVMEHCENDVVNIEGVKFSGDFFRMLKSSMATQCLYVLRKNEQGVIMMSRFETLCEAREFFDEKVEGRRSKV